MEKQRRASTVGTKPRKIHDKSHNVRPIQVATPPHHHNTT